MAGSSPSRGPTVRPGDPRCIQGNHGASRWFMPTRDMRRLQGPGSGQGWDRAGSAARLKVLMESTRGPGPCPLRARDLAPGRGQAPTLPGGPGPGAQPSAPSEPRGSSESLHVRREAQLPLHPGPAAEQPDHLPRLSEAAQETGSWEVRHEVGGGARRPAG